MSILTLLNLILAKLLGLEVTSVSVNSKLDRIQSDLTKLRSEVLSSLGVLSQQVKTLDSRVDSIVHILGSVDSMMGTLNDRIESLNQKSDLQTELLNRILDSINGLPAARILFDAELEGQIFQGVTSMILTAVQKVSLSIKPVDAKGNPAPIDGVPVWASSDPTIVTVQPAADGLSAVAFAVGPVGVAQVSVTADADMGTGTKQIAGVLDLDVRAAEAVALSITAGTPENQ